MIQISLPTLVTPFVVWKLNGPPADSTIKFASRTAPVWASILRIRPFPEVLESTSSRKLWA